MNLLQLFTAEVFLKSVHYKLKTAFGWTFLGVYLILKWLIIFNLIFWMARLMSMDILDVV